MGGLSFNLDLSGIIFGMVSIAISAVGTIGLIVSMVFYWYHKQNRPTMIALPSLWIRSSLAMMGWGGLGALIFFLCQDQSSLRSLRKWLDHSGATMWIVIFIGVVAVTVILHDGLRRKL